MAYQKRPFSYAKVARAARRRRRTKRGARSKYHRRYLRSRLRRIAYKKRVAQFGHPSVTYFRKDGYNDGRINFDLDLDDYKGRTPDQVAKEVRKEVMQYGLRGGGYTQAALEHAEGSKSKARGLLRAYLNSFESGVKDQIKDLEERRAERLAEEGD